MTTGNGEPRAADLKNAPGYGKQAQTVPPRPILECLEETYGKRIEDWTREEFLSVLEDLGSAFDRKLELFRQRATDECAKLHVELDYTYKWIAYLHRFMRRKKLLFPPLPKKPKWKMSPIERLGYSGIGRPPPKRRGRPPSTGLTDLDLLREIQVGKEELGHRTEIQSLTLLAENYLKSKGQNTAGNRVRTLAKNFQKRVSVARQKKRVSVARQRSI